MGFSRKVGGPFLLGESCTIADLFLYFALEAFRKGTCASETGRRRFIPRLVLLGAVADLDGLKERLGSSGARCHRHVFPGTVRVVPGRSGPPAPPHRTRLRSDDLHENPQITERASSCTTSLWCC